jgi:hypothetical protein
MSSLKQRIKNKPVKIKCSREKRKEMMLTGRYTHAYSILTLQHELFFCPVYIQQQCYWSKPKHV